MAQKCFFSEFYQIFKKEITPILCQVFQIMEEEGTHLNALYEISINLISKITKTLQKKSQTNSLHEHRNKNP